MYASPVIAEDPIDLTRRPAPDNPNLIAGFLSEWPSGADLSTIPAGYNVIGLVFTPGSYGQPNLTPVYLTDDDVIRGIRTLKEQGRTVLLTLGGANTYIAIDAAGQTDFMNQLRDAVNRYGFDGVILDLEGESMTAADNQTVIPAALRGLKFYYQGLGQSFIIAMTPEFPTLRGPDGAYIPYVEGLEGAYDFVFPQYYNQGDDGVWLDGQYLAQNDDDNKALFLYTLTDALIHGNQEFTAIPADALAIGLPATPNAAFNGYVQDPEDVAWTLSQLAQDRHPIRGLMTWSINEDSGQGYPFATTYSSIVYR